MSVSEFAESEHDAALRFAGSIDNGHTDAEYTLPPYRVQPPLGDVVAELLQSHAHLTQRVAWLEAQEHKRLNAEPMTNTRFAVTVAESLYWQHRDERESAEAQAELDALRQFKASVPWDAIRHARAALSYYCDVDEASDDTNAIAEFLQMYAAHASQEPTLSLAERLSREAVQSDLDANTYAYADAQDAASQEPTQ